MNLCDLKPGQKARVASLSNDGAIFRRLIDIGLIEGTEVECVGVSPMGNPKAYLIRGAIIALRDEASSYIKVSEIWD